MAWTSGNLFSGGADIVKIDAIDVGATAGGIQFSREVNWLDYFIDQLPLKVKKGVIDQSMTIATNLSEATLANMRRAWSIPSSNLISSSLNVVEASGTEEVHFYCEGPTVDNATNHTRVYDFGRCVSLAAGVVSVARDAMAAIPLTLEVLAESALTGKFGTIYDKA